MQINPVGSVAAAQQVQKVIHLNGIQKPDSNSFKIALKKAVLDNTNTLGVEKVSREKPLDRDLSTEKITAVQPGPQNKKELHMLAAKISAGLKENNPTTDLAGVKNELTISTDENRYRNFSADMSGMDFSEPFQKGNNVDLVA